MKSIVLCSTPRSGSTLVCEQLTCTGVFGRPGELFLPWLQRGEGRPQAFWDRHWKRVLAVGSTPNGVFGVKVMSSYADAVQARLIRALPDVPANDALYHGLGGDDALFIRLTRQDRLKQAMSRFMIRSTGISHSAGGPSAARVKARSVTNDYNEAVEFNAAAVRGILDRIAAEEAWWDDWFAAHTRARVLTITYETVVRDQSYLAGVAEALGIAPDFPQPAPGLKRLSNHVSKLFIDLYRDVEARMAAGDVDEDTATEQVLRGHLAAAPEDPLLNFQLAAVLRRTGHVRRACAAMALAVQGRPDNAHYHAAMGALERLAGRRRKAERMLRHALSIDGDLAVAHHDLSLLLLGRDVRGAVDHAQAALDAQPQNAVYWSGLGRAQIAAHDRGAGEASLRKALELCPDLHSAQSALRTLHYSRGRRTMHRLLGLAASRLKR